MKKIEVRVAAFMAWRRLDTALRKKLLQPVYPDCWYGAAINSKESKEKYVICRYEFPDFALFAAAIQYAFTARYFRKKGFIPVMDLEPAEQYNEDRIGIVDAWGSVFEQTITPKDAAKKEWAYKDTVNSPHAFLIRDCLRLNGKYKDHWIRAKDDGWRPYYEKAGQMVKETWTLRSEVKNAWEEQVNQKRSPADTVLGVALREEFTKSADEVRTEKEKGIYKRHPLVPEVADTLQMVERQMEIWNCNKIFLSAERWESVELYQKYFGAGNVFCINRAFMTRQNQAMYYENGKATLVEKPFIQVVNANQKFAAYASEIWGLSRCEYLLAAKCSGAIAALTFNGGKYRDICILSDENRSSLY